MDAANAGLYAYLGTEVFLLYDGEPSASEDLPETPGVLIRSLPLIQPLELFVV